MVKTLEKKLDRLSRKMSLSRDRVLSEAFKALEEKTNKAAEFEKESKFWDRLGDEVWRNIKD